MKKTALYREILGVIQKDKDFKIVFIGDSITSAEWVHPNWRDTFEYILKFSFDEFDGDDWWIPEWNLKFYNYSLDGASTKNFLEMVLTAEKEINPDLYIIMGTSNDMELGISIEDHKTNLSSLFKLIDTKSKIYSPDIYSNSEEVNKNYRPYVNTAIETAPKQSCTIINGFEIFKQFDLDKFYTLDLDKTERKTDGPYKDPLHPNSLGNIYIAKMFLEEGFGIDVDPEKYLQDIRSDTVKYPRW